MAATSPSLPAALLPALRAGGAPLSRQGWMLAIAQASFSVKKKCPAESWPQTGWLCNMELRRL